MRSFFCLAMERLFFVKTLPKIKTNERSIRAPRLRYFFDFNLILSVHSIDPGDGSPQTQIPDRKNIFPAEGKDQHHLGSPAADTFDQSEMGDHLFIR